MKYVMMLIMSFAALGCAAITATKDYVDRATNETLRAANAYTDAHAGGGGVSTNDVLALIEPATNAVYSAAVVEAADYTDTKIIDAYDYTDQQLRNYQPLMRGGDNIEIRADWSINATGLVNAATLVSATNETLRAANAYTDAAVADKVTESGVRSIIADEGFVATNTTGYVEGNFKVFAPNGGGGGFVEISDGWGSNTEWGVRFYPSYMDVIPYGAVQPMSNIKRIYYPEDNGTLSTREWSTNNFGGAIRTNELGYVTNSFKVYSIDSGDNDYIEISDNWNDWGARYYPNKILTRYNSVDHNLLFPEEDGTLATREWATNAVSGKYLALNRVTSSGTTKDFIRYGSRVSSSYSQVGDYSVTFGQRLTAKGARSFAANADNAAMGNDSAAFGGDNTAANTYAFVVGETNAANGRASFVAGGKAKTESAHAYAFAWNGDTNVLYSSKAKGTFNVNPIGGTDGFYVGATNLTTLLAQSAGMPDVSCTVPGIKAIKSTVNNNRLEISKENIPTLVTTNSAIAYYAGMSVRKFTTTPTINMTAWPDGEACFVILDLPATAMAPISNFILTDPSYTMTGRVHTAIYRVGNNLFCSPICTNVGRTDAEM